MCVFTALDRNDLVAMALLLGCDYCPEGAYIHVYMYYMYNLHPIVTGSRPGRAKSTNEKNKKGDGATVNYVHCVFIHVHENTCTADSIWIYETFGIPQSEGHRDF